MRTFRAFVLAAAAAGLAGRAAAQCPTDLPHVAGTWQTLPYQMAINPISATLLHSGKVFLVAGSENDAYNNTSGAQSYRAAVWDPTGVDQSSIVTKQIGYDVFCSGTAQLPHGRTLTIGGSASYAFTGESHATFFDPVTEQMSGAQSMADGRWYGTATALGDGRIVAFSGLKSNGATSQNIQIYDLKNTGAGWGSTINEPFVPPLYPRAFLLPDGRLFFTSHGSGGSVATAWFFNPGSSTWTSSVAKTRDRAYGAGVILPLLPPSYTPKIMAFGGGPISGEESTELIDLSAGSPSWTPKANMSAKRRQMNSVLLPNGRVLLSGGSQADEVPDTPGKTADVYDPATNVMNPGGTAAYSRLYHSTALLLPDATVASLGSNPGPRGKYASAIEIYTPAYLFDANDQLITSGRPAITSVTPGPIGYGAGFTVTYTSGSSIASAVLMRPGSTTHAFDMEQRMIGLCGPSPQPACTGSGTLTLTAPPNGNIAPPGYYMLFLLDASGVPSKAEFLELASVTANPPDGVISSPLSDVTIDAGGTVSFGTTTNATKWSWVFQGGSPGTSTSKNPGNVTFSTPGEYVVSLTVLDAANNSDPSPPTRKIKVLPGSADFDIAVTPAIRSVTPGQSTTYTVTVTPLKGFSGTVSFGVDSEGGLPAGVSGGGFSPSTISGGGSTTLTMLTTTSAVPYATSMTVTGTSGAIGHTASSTLVVNLATPTGLSASTADSLVNLNWNTVPGATGYRVGRSLGGPYRNLACPTGHSWSDTNVQNGVTYHYAVSAVFTGGPNEGGVTSASAEILATPPCALPSYSGVLTAAKSLSGDTVWTWTSGGAPAYDLVRGDLDTLHATGGDFEAALDALPGGENACLANNTSALSLTDPYGDPPVGNGEFALLRAATTSCAAHGTLDDGAPGQSGSRDAEVAASPRACP